MIPKLLIIDRDGLINYASKQDNGFYYILDIDHLIIKPGVFKAFQILKAINKDNRIKVVLATKQKCISKGLIDLKGVQAINRILETKLDFKFDKIYIEPEKDDKIDMFKQILSDFKMDPRDTLVIDDDGDNCYSANQLNTHTLCNNNLLDAICYLFQLD